MNAIEQLTLFFAAVLAAILSAFARPMVAAPAGWDEWDPFVTRVSDRPRPGAPAVDEAATATARYAGYQWLGGQR